MTIDIKDAAREAADHIQTIEELSAEEKARFVAMLDNGEDPLDVLDQVEDTIQRRIDQIFEEAGVRIDENDPEYKAEYEKMVKETQTAEDEFNTEMAAIEKEAQKIHDELPSQIEDAKIQALRDSLTQN